MSTYANLSDEVKQTLKHILATEKLNTMMNSANKQVYSNLTDEAKLTLKQMLTLETFSNHIRQNIGSYASLTDEAKYTLKEILSLIQNNTNIKSSKQGTYSELTDIAKETIKGFIATYQLNNNVKPITGQNITPFTQDAKATHKQETAIQTYGTNVIARKRDVAFDMNDLAKMTQRQELLNENYIGNMTNPNVGSQQTDFYIAPTQKDMNKLIDYKSGAKSVGVGNKPATQDAERHMYQNINKEIIALGRTPTNSSAKDGPRKELYNTMKQQEKPNFNVTKPGTLTTKINLEDRSIFNVQKIKDNTYYDERLYHELLDQFDDNPLVNNVQTEVESKFKN